MGLSGTDAEGEKDRPREAGLVDRIVELQRLRSSMTEPVRDSQCTLAPMLKGCGRIEGIGQTAVVTANASWHKLWSAAAALWVLDSLDRPRSRGYASLRSC
jgi:hypothetical protein